MLTRTRLRRLEVPSAKDEALPWGLLPGAALALAAMLAAAPIAETFLVAVSQVELLNQLTTGGDSIGSRPDPVFGGKVHHPMIWTIVWCVWCLLPVAFSWRVWQYTKMWLTGWCIFTIVSLGGLWVFSSWLVVAPTERLLRELQPPTDSGAGIAQSVSILEDSAATDSEREQAYLVFRKLGVQSRTGFVESADQQLRGRLVDIATATDGSAKQRFYAARALLALDVQTQAERAAIIEAFRMAMLAPDADLRRLASEYAKHSKLNSSSSGEIPTHAETDVTSQE